MLILEKTFLQSSINIHVLSLRRNKKNIKELSLRSPFEKESIKALIR